MKIYTEKNLEADSVEVLLNHFELKQLVDALCQFEAKISQFKSENRQVEKLGFTHMHYKDNCKENEADIVFYVNLDEK